MKSKLWRFVSLLVASTMVIGLFACAPTAAPTEAPTEPPKVEEPTTAPAVEEATATAEPTPTPSVQLKPLKEGATKVTVFVGFGTGTDPGQIDVHNTIANQFNDTHDDIQVEFMTTPYEEARTKFATMVAGGQSPDIVMPTGISGLAEFIDEWKDLTPYIDADKYDLTDFYGPTVALHNYPGRGQLGLPLCVYPSAIYYNVDLFDAAGVDYPPHKFGEPYADGQPWTYDKLVEIGKKLTLDASGNDANSPAFDAQNIKQWAYDMSWQDLFNFAPKFGQTRANGVSEDGKTSLVGDQAFIDAMTWLYNAAWTSHISANAEQSGAFYDTAGDPFGSGLVAMWESHTWMAYAYKSWSEAFTWDVAAIPAVGSNPIVANVDADTFTIPKSAKNADAAWEVVKWFFEPETYMKLVNNYGCMPARKSLANEWMDAKKADYPNVDFDVFVQSLDYIDTSPNHEAYRPEYRKIQDAVGNAYSKMNSGEATDIPTLMKDLNAEVQKILDDYWASQ